MEMESFEVIVVLIRARNTHTISRLGGRYLAGMLGEVNKCLKF